MRSRARGPPELIGVPRDGCKLSRGFVVEFVRTGRPVKGMQIEAFVRSSSGKQQAATLEPLRARRWSQVLK